jgi:hypothetical protein
VESSNGVNQSIDAVLIDMKRWLKCLLSCSFLSFFVACDDTKRLNML